MGTDQDIKKTLRSSDTSQGTIKRSIPAILIGLVLLLAGSLVVLLTGRLDWSIQELVAEYAADDLTGFESTDKRSSYFSVDYFSARQAGRGDVYLGLLPLSRRRPR